MQKTTNVFPIIGGRKVEHLVANLEALDIILTDEQIKSLEDVVPFDPGFPSNFIGDGLKPNIFMSSTAVVEKLPIPQPVRVNPAIAN